MDAENCRPPTAETGRAHETRRVEFQAPKTAENRHKNQFFLEFLVRGGLSGGASKGRLNSSRRQVRVSRGVIGLLQASGVKRCSFVLPSCPVKGERSKFARAFFLGGEHGSRRSTGRA